MHVKVDVGGGSWLPVCRCGWRGLPGLSRLEALNEARRHEVRAHPGDTDVLRQIYHNRS